ncbi:hypothetical protein B484DRAFT_416586 [Ochromonadaceae sp. CCMP2298]|nr:hypothetical protein B484DRAFT_416586 [Ochromonadaceae sp. CCMP2298]
MNGEGDTGTDTGSGSNSNTLTNGNAATNTGVYTDAMLDHPDFKHLILFAAPILLVLLMIFCIRWCASKRVQAKFGLYAPLLGEEESLTYDAPTSITANPITTAPSAPPAPTSNPWTARTEAESALESRRLGGRNASFKI